MRVPSIREPQLQERAGPRVRISAPIDTTLAQAGHTTQQLGRAAEAMADKEFVEAVRTQTLEADTSLSRAANAMLFDPQNGALMKRGKNAFDLPNQVLPQYDETVKQQIEAIPSQAAKRVFQQSAQQKRDQIINSLNQHEGRERNAFNDQTAESAIAQGVEDMGLYVNDPEAMKAAEGKVSSVLRLQGERKGWDTQTTLANTREAISSGYGLATSNLIQAGDYQKAKELLPYVSDKQRPSFEKAIAGAEKEATVSGILARYEKSTSAGEQALAGITDRDIRQAVNSGLGGIRQEKQRQYANELASLSGDIASGRVTKETEAKVFALYERGVLSVDELESKIAGVSKAREKSIKDGSAQVFARDAYTRSMPLDPNDKDAKKGIDQLYLASGVTPGSIESAQLASDIAAKTNVIPESVVSWARAGVLSDNPAMAIKAADSLAMIQEQAPTAYGFYADSKTKALAEVLNEQTRAGVPAEIAFKNARRLAEQTPAEQEQLKKLYNDNFKVASKSGKANTEALQDLLDSDDTYDRQIFGGAPKPNPLLASEFDRGTERYFRLTGDIESARKLAFKDVRAKWGYSTVNGTPELMPYAPEQMYGITRELIDKDIPVFQKKDVFTGETKSIEAKDVKLIPTADTARTNGLEWALGYVSEYGDIEVLDLGGHNYRLPVDHDSIRNASKAIAAEQINEAKMLRDQAQKDLQRRREASIMGMPGAR